MNLRGGVIIIGSLIWEDHLEFKKKGENFIRRDWRNQNLLPLRKFTEVPICYNRESSSREDTYSMIFTKSKENSLGQGIILEFNHAVNSFENIERQAIALARAEGIYTNDNKRLSSSWGSVGLLINPKLLNTDYSKFEIINKKWSDLYQTYKQFTAANYKCEEDQEPPINQDGILTINWQNAMNEFDVLMATPVVPKPKQLLTSQQIAQKMIDKQYDTYFKSNLANGIKTSQDAEILNLLPTR